MSWLSERRTRKFAAQVTRRLRGNVGAVSFFEPPVRVEELDFLEALLSGYVAIPIVVSKTGTNEALVFGLIVGKNVAATWTNMLKSMREMMLVLQLDSHTKNSLIAGIEVQRLSLQREHGVHLEALAP